MMRRIALWFGFAGTLVGGAVYMLAQATDSDALTDKSSAVLFVDVPQYVDPACLWPVLDAALQPDASPAPDSIAVRGCAPAGSLTLNEDGWARVAIGDGLPEDEGGVASRRTGVRIAQVGSHLSLVLETYDNWGGTGVFGTLVTARLEHDGDRLGSLHAYGFGDRCNGGLAGTEITPDGLLRVRANMTPWDILMSVHGAEVLGDMGDVPYGAVSGQAPSCASCCSAVRREYVVDARAGTMTEVGLRYDGQAASSMPDNPLVICLEEAVRRAGGADALVEGQAEGEVLLQVIAACAGVEPVPARAP